MRGRAGVEAKGENLEQGPSAEYGAHLSYDPDDYDLTQNQKSDAQLIEPPSLLSFLELFINTD